MGRENCIKYMAISGFWAVFNVPNVLNEKHFRFTIKLSSGHLQGTVNANACKFASNSRIPFYSFPSAFVTIIKLVKKRRKTTTLINLPAATYKLPHKWKNYALCNCV